MCNLKHPFTQFVLLSCANIFSEVLMPRGVSIWRCSMLIPIVFSKIGVSSWNRWLRINILFEQLSHGLVFIQLYLLHIIVQSTKEYKIYNSTWFLGKIVDSTIIWYFNKDFLQSTVFLAKKSVYKPTGFVEENCRFYNQNWTKSIIFIYLPPPPPYQQGIKQLFVQNI